MATKAKAKASKAAPTAGRWVVRVHKSESWATAPYLMSDGVHHETWSSAQPNATVFASPEKAREALAKVEPPTWRLVVVRLVSRWERLAASFDRAAVNPGADIEAQGAWMLAAQSVRAMMAEGRRR